MRFVGEKLNEGINCYNLFVVNTSTLDGELHWVARHEMEIKSNDESNLKFTKLGKARVIQRRSSLL